MTKEQGRECYSHEIQVWNCRNARLDLEFTWPFNPDKYLTFKAEMKKLKNPDKHDLDCIIESIDAEYYYGLIKDYI